MKYERSKIISQGRSLNNDDFVEASPKDSVWGIGLEDSSLDAICPRKWKGENLLGFALMEVRDMLNLCKPSF